MTPQKKARRRSGWRWVAAASMVLCMGMMCFWGRSYLVSDDMMRFAYFPEGRILRHDRVGSRRGQIDVSLRRLEIIDAYGADILARGRAQGGYPNKWYYWDDYVPTAGASARTRIRWWERMG